MKEGKILNKVSKRGLSSILSFVIAFSTVTSTFAQDKNEPIGDSAEISFAASKYIVAEDENELKVKIKRSGNKDRKVSVAFKVADFTAEYGVDYVVLDENGDELPVADGIVPDESEFDEISDNTIITEVEDKVPVIDEEIIENSEQSNDNVKEDTITDEIINDAGEVEELPTITENVIDEEKPAEDSEKAEPDKTESEKTEFDKTESEKTDSEKTESEKTESEKTEPDKTESEKTKSEETSDNTILPETDDDTSSTDEQTEDTSEQSKDNVQEDSVTDETITDTDDVADTEAENDNVSDVENPEEVSDSKKDEEILADKGMERASTGSSLLDAQAQYLQLPDDDRETAEAVENVLTEANEYFQNARGAVGVVTFQEGETEKEITIKMIDNDLAQADKVIILSLMGVNGDENTSLAANPTSYINIMDDEGYETPVIVPDVNEITLTEQQPVHELTLTRTEGIDYYTSILVSTVKGTAQEGYHYEKIENASVAFTPGETEKKIKIAAENFDEEMTLGIRLESDGTCEIGEEYIGVTMSAKHTQDTEIDDVTATPTPMRVDNNMERTTNVLGKPTTEKKLDDFSMQYGPSTGSQDGWHRTSWNAGKGWTDYGLYETYRHSGRTWVASKPINLSGVDKMEFWHQNIGEYTSYHLFVEMLRNKDKYNYAADGDRRFSQYGKHDWTRTKMDVSDLSGDYYVRFGIRNHKWARDNAQGWLGNPVTLTWHKYDFSVQNKQVFNRLEYDYADKNGEALKIAFTDGKDDYDYIPSVKLVDNQGKEVSGFYANANQIIKPVSTNPELDKKYGIELEGVYLYTKDNDSLYRKDRQYPYNDHWYTDHTIWIPASGTTLNQNLAERIDKTFGRGQTIKVMPKFKQKTITLHIHNTDNEKTYIANMNDKNAESYRDWGAKGYYNRYTFPMNSKIKVRAVPAKNMTVTGFLVDYWSKPDKEDKIYSDSKAPERMTYVLSENMSFYPKTENNGMNIAYMPNADKVIQNLQGMVFTQPSTAQDANDILYSNANGDINIPTVYSGMLWTLRAKAPDGYYVKWTNGTGDIKNVNGKIDVSSDPNINEETENTKKFQNMYAPVYGDLMSGNIVQNNTKYYYEFVKNGNETGQVWANVKRENGSFYDVVSRKKLELSPATNAQVSVAGTSGFTDGNGDCIITLKNVPTSGLVSVIVNDNETVYPTTALANYMSITLPAYEGFKPKALSIKYSDSVTNKINGTVVNIKDDTLNVMAQVESNGTLEPTNAKFYIQKLNGTKIDCSEDKKFKNSFVNGTAMLSFNPKGVMDSGDKIYVAFIDQNSKQYKSMDLGYDFVAPLNLKTFLFPLIGSELISDTYNSAVELIGDPLGNISLGKIGFDEPDTNVVTPPGMDPDKYQYIMSTYQFGDYHTAVKTFNGESGTDEEGEEGNQTESEKAKDKAKKSLDKNGKNAENGGFKTNKSFSWEVSPKIAFAMQLTTRNVDGQSKYFFEELDFIVGLDFDVDGKITVSLPIGMNLIVTGRLNGNITGIFQLKTDYTGDSTWDKHKVEYSPETFGLFEEIDHVNRKAYLMLDPNISIGLGVQVAIIEVGGHANFKFDMDFEFGLNAGSLGSRMYGDMRYNFDYYIKVLSFNVYTNATKETTVKLFSENADGHIEPDIIPGLFSANGEDTIQSVQSTRDYLSNQSEWNSNVSSVTFRDIEADNTEETLLQSGIYPSAKTTLTPLGNGKLFMTFIGDVESRSPVNRTGLFYSIFNGAEWSKPELIDDDGTLDDYPNVFDRGDKLLISWSSADKELPDNATTQEALSALDIKTVFFDKNTEKFEELTKLTKKTEQDYAADVEPKAAYDKEENRLILYYTKTEYYDADTLTDITNAPSVIAYRFYENGKWNDETSYTDKELAGVVDKEAYKTNWYGQRFLDIRLDKTSKEMLRIVDTDAISYNKLALHAWTVDYDKNLNTVNDRDIFMQIYDFEKNEFTHIIKMTPYAGAYQTPKFGRYKDEIFLFYSAIGGLENGEDKEESGIAYFEVSNIISNKKFTKVSENSNEYYKLTYETTSKATTSQDGTVIPEQKQTVTIMPSYAVKLDGYVNNYSVDIDEKERMYLTWANSDQAGARQVYTSIFDSEPKKGAEADENNQVPQNAEWSEAFQLTNEADMSYRNVDAAVMDGNLYIVSAKTPYITNGDSKKLDDANTSLVMLVHTPYAQAVTVAENALTADTEYIYPNTGFVLTSTIKNEGTKFIDTPITFKFTMMSNGKTTELGEQKVNNVWGAGKTLCASVNVPALPEIPDDLTFYAEIMVDNEPSNVIKQEMKVVKEYSLASNGEASLLESADGHTLHIPLKNQGNIASPQVAIKLYTMNDGTEKKLIDAYTVDTIAENTSITVEKNVQIPDSAFVIEGSDGVANIIAVVQAGGEDIITLETKAHKGFDEKAIETMCKVTDVFIKGSNIIYAKYMEDINIETEIGGTAGDEVTVIWESSDSDVVYVREDNTLFAAGNGTAHLTGYVVPSVQNIVFNYDKTTEQGDILKTIPSTLHQTVTADVIVNTTGTGGGSSGGSGNGNKHTISFVTNGAGNMQSITVSKYATVADIPTPVKAGYTFEGWFKDPAFTQPFDETTPITSDMTLYAKWSATTETSTGDWSNPFSDVSSDNWFFESVRYVCKNNIFAGMTDTTFEPNTHLTRAMLVSVLYRMEGSPDIQNEILGYPFADVKGESWYGNAVYWARHNGIVSGYSDEIFAPNDKITREQFAAIVERYADYKGNKTSTPVDMSQFADVGEISDWAMTSVSWAVGSGLISGKGNGILDPKGSATRAEAASILQRYIENTSENNQTQ